MFLSLNYFFLFVLITVILWASTWDDYWSNSGWPLHSTSAPHRLNLHIVIPRIKSTWFKWWIAWEVEFVHITVEIFAKYWTMSSLHDIDEIIVASCLRMQLNDSTGPAPSHSTIKVFWLVYVAPTWPSFQTVIEQVWRPPKRKQHEERNWHTHF